MAKFFQEICGEFGEEPLTTTKLRFETNGYVVPFNEQLTYIYYHDIAQHEKNWVSLVVLLAHS